MPAPPTTRPPASTATVSQTRSTSARMCVEKNTVVLRGERRDHLQDLAAPDGVKRAGRLVEQQQARRVDERLRDAEALLHATRVAADPGGDTVQAGEPEQRLDALAAHRSGQAEELCRQLEVLAWPSSTCRSRGRPAGSRSWRARRRRRAWCRVRRRSADPELGRARPARIRRVVGVPGAVGAEEAEHGTLRHDEVDTVERMRFAVDLGEARDGDGRGGRLAPAPRPRRGPLPPLWPSPPPPPRAHTARPPPRLPAVAPRRQRRPRVSSGGRGRPDRSPDR